MMRKTTTTILSIAAGLLLVASCSQGSSKVEKLPGITKNFSDSASYAIGASLGNMLKDSGFDNLNMKEVYKAIEDVLADNKLKVEMHEANWIISNYAGKMEEAINNKNLEEARLFFEKNSKEEGVVETESGLQYKIIEEGNGLPPTPKDTVEVNYKGSLLNGTEFDSSYERGEPAVMELGSFIPGWVEGLQLISEGGRIKLFIPSSLAYGNRSVSAEIKGGSMLIFEVELLKITRYVEEEESEES